MSVKIDVNGKPCNPTLKAYPNFNANTDVELLKKAMDGLGKCLVTAAAAVALILPLSM